LEQKSFKALNLRDSIQASNHFFIDDYCGLIFLIPLTYRVKMKTLSIDLQQLICILDESKIIHTKRHNINMLIHTIKHPDYGIAAIMEEAIGGGTLIYEQ
jgi:hypothetical protein